jgi:putative membrane protein
MDELARSLSQLPATLVWVVLGLLLFGLSFWAVARLSPFSVRKEIEEDQNVALAVIIAAIFLGIAYIIGAAISSP